MPSHWLIADLRWDRLRSRYPPNSPAPIGEQHLVLKHKAKAEVSPAPATTLALLLLSRRSKEETPITLILL